MLQKPWTPARVRAYERTNHIIHVVGAVALALGLGLAWVGAHALAQAASAAIQRAF